MRQHSDDLWSRDESSCLQLKHLHREGTKPSAPQSALLQATRTPRKLSWLCLLAGFRVPTQRKKCHLPKALCFCCSAWQVANSKRWPLSKHLAQQSKAKASPRICNAELSPGEPAINSDASPHSNIYEVVFTLWLPPVFQRIIMKAENKTIFKILVSCYLLLTACVQVEEGH